MNLLNFEDMGAFEAFMIIIALAVVTVILYFQISSYIETKKKIEILANFFPPSDSYRTIESSITKNIIESKSKLHNFITNPPLKQEKTPRGLDIDDEDLVKFEEDILEYTDVTLVKCNKICSTPFSEVVYETNAYLCKNAGTSSEFPILQEICERKLESLENQISNSINVPLYLGLAGTFIGIITGLIGIAFNVNDLFSDSNVAPLRNLLIGVVIAMIASLVGLGLMIFNSSINYKNANNNLEKNKNAYYDFLRRELMPALSNSMATSLNSLKGVLGEFVGKFGHNLDAYTNSAELLNDNIEKQHLLLVEVNKLKRKELSIELAEAVNNIKESSQSFQVFKTYQESLDKTISDAGSVVGKVNDIIKNFDDFATSLKIVVKNQEQANELQNQFKLSMEKHFPTGSDTREMYRKQFDELTTDAKVVSDELNEQLRASTEYIKQFVESNKRTFDSLYSLNDVLKNLIEYTNVQATCYKDLKTEIEGLRQEHIKSQQNAAQLNADLLKAVREMTSAIKSVKN